MDCALAIEGLSKSYSGKQVLQDVNLTIDKGECLGLIGEKRILQKHPDQYDH